MKNDRAGAVLRTRVSRWRTAQTSRRLASTSTPLFWSVLLLFVAVGGWLAHGNNFPGGWDSENYLATARNVVEGRGFVTDIVQDLVTPHQLPGPETVRAPGAVYLVALVFRIFGLSLAAMLFLNVLIIAASAALLRIAVRDFTPTWIANIAGMALLASPSNYELTSWHNNNLLVLLVVTGILIATRTFRGALRGWWLTLACATLIAVGFLVKQTYILSFVPLTILLIGTAPGVTFGRRVTRLAIAGALSALIASPYWVATWLKFGTPLYSPIQQLRLPTRYLQADMYTSIRTVLYGQPAETYRSIVTKLGVAGFLSREIANDRELAVAVFRHGGIALILALGGLVFWRARKWRLYATGCVLLIAPIFDAMYWIVEDRYLYPVFAVAVFLATIGAANFRAWARREPASEVLARVRTVSAALIAIAALSAAIEVPRFLHASRFQTRTPPPDWVGAFREVPENAVVMTSASVPHVNWWTRRRTVIEPVGTRQELRTVLETYHPAFYFDDRPGDADKASFREQELTSIARGHGWELYQIHSEAGR